MHVDVTFKNKLRSRTVFVLARNGIHSEEQLRDVYPKKLLGLNGIGMLTFREIEKVFFPGHLFQPDKGDRVLTNFQQSLYKNTVSREMPEDF